MKIGNSILSGILHMFRGRTSKHVFLPFFLVVVIGVFLFSAQGVQAQFSIGSIAGGVITTIINGILAGILWILGWILALGGLLANYMLQPGPITTSPIVQTGWGIVRDFANMFFILILLGIALDFILFESFGVKRALPQLLIVALLINFSLPIAGILIDFANVFANFFISKVTGNCTIAGCGFTETLAQVLGLTNVFDANFLQQTADEAAAGAGLMADQAFAIFFMLGTIVIMYALALMFLIRIGWLYLLLVILPGVLVLSAFPPTRGYLGQWTHRFVQWTMFAPVATFFLYLSMLIFQGNTAADAAATMTNGADPSVSGIIQQGFTYIMVWFFMLASLMAAQSMGVKMAGATMKVFSNAGKWTRGKLSSAGKKVGGEAARRAGIDQRIGKAAEWAATNKVLSTLGVGRGLRGMAVKTEQAIKKQGELTPQEKASYEKYSDERLNAEYEELKTNKLPYAQAKAGKIYEMLAKRGAHVMKNDNGTPNTEKTNERAKEAYGFAKKYGDRDAMKTIRKANPVAYQEIAKDEWAEERGKGNIVEVKDAKGNVKELNKNTGKTLEETKNRAFEEMTSADFENLKGTWTEQAVKDFVASGVMSQGHLRMANINADQHFMDYVGNALGDKKTMEALKAKSQNFFNYLKSGGSYESYGLRISDAVLAEMGEERSVGKKGGVGGEEPLIKVASAYESVDKYKRK